MLVGALAVAWLAACSKEAPPKPRPKHPNVLLISLDSTRPDHLGCYGYATRTGARTSANIDAVAQQGVLFEHAVSTTTWTLPSHHALMSGLPDLAHGVLSDGYGPTLSRVQIAQLLANAGYATAGYYSGPYLGDHYGFGDGFDEWRNASGVEEALIAAGAEEAGDPAASHDPSGLQQAASKVAGAVEQSYHVTASAKRVSDAGRDFLDAQQKRKPEQPFFLFLHYFDVHYDFAPPEESYARAFWSDGKPRLNGDHFFENPAIHSAMKREELDGVQSYYDGEIRWVDSQVGRVLEKLAALGLERDTIVCIVSDHGDEFFDHGAKGHRQNLFQSTLSMGWIMRWPGMLEAGRRIPGRVSMADVAPTLVDLCGVVDQVDFFEKEIPGLEPGDRIHGMWGSSLRPQLEGAASDDRESLAFLANQWQDPAHPVYSFALVTDRFKVVVTQVYSQQPGSDGVMRKVPGEVRGRVYDLIADPNEQRDLARSQELEVQRAIARYDAAYSNGGRLGRWLANVECGPPPPPLSKVELKRLEQLGYAQSEIVDQRPPLARGTRLGALTPRPPPFPRVR